MTFSPVNWNIINDEVDKIVWDRMTSNFWLPEKIALSNDIPSWGKLTEEEHERVMKVFAGLTLLDTLQANTGAVSLLQDASTQQEEACFTFIAAMESIHAKSYSSIFMTLCSSQKVNEVFRWAETDDHLQFKAQMIDSWYKKSPLHKKAASVLLESFLFYSGFYLPLKLSSQGQLTNTADIISLIIRDEAIHGYYIGHKFQQEFKKLSETEQYDFHVEVNMLLAELYDNEMRYTEKIYDGSGYTEDVKKFLNYNANKALHNLGFYSLYDKEETDVSQEILSSLSAEQGGNHDFFSSSGSSYQMGTAEATEDEDWDF